VIFIFIPNNLFQKLFHFLNRKNHNMLRKFVLSNVVVAFFMVVTFPAIAASNVSKITSTSSATSMLLAQVDEDALNKAGNALERAANAMVAAQSAKSTQQVEQHFQTALVAMEESASFLEKAGVPEGAKAMNRALASIQAAVNAGSESEADEFVLEAGKALDDVIAAVEKAAN
jgi:leucyl-tRNA synthetase